MRRRRPRRQARACGPRIPEGSIDRQPPRRARWSRRRTSARHSSSNEIRIPPSRAGGKAKSIGLPVTRTEAKTRPSEVDPAEARAIGNEAITTWGEERHEADAVGGGDGPDARAGAAGDRARGVPRIEWGHRL